MAKVRNSTKASKQIVIDPHDILFVGVDVHLKSFDVALWSGVGERVVAQWKQDASAELLETKLAPFYAQIQRVSYEAGPTGFGLAQFLLERGWPVEVISATHSPVPAIGGKKSDGWDCKLLARQSAAKMLLDYNGQLISRPKDEALWPGPALLRQKLELVA